MSAALKRRPSSVMVPRATLRDIRHALATCMSPLSEWEGADAFPEMVDASAALAALDALLRRPLKAGRK